MLVGAHHVGFEEVSIKIWTGGPESGQMLLRDDGFHWIMHLHKSDTHISESRRGFSKALFCHGWTHHKEKSSEFIFYLKTGSNGQIQIAVFMPLKP